MFSFYTPWCLQRGIKWQHWTEMGSVMQKKTSQKLRALAQASIMSKKIKNSHECIFHIRISTMHISLMFQLYIIKQVK